MTFEEYMDSKLPNWKEKIDEVMIIELRNLYNLFMEYQKIAFNIFDVIITNSDRYVNYSEDLIKTQIRLNTYNKIIDNNIEVIQKVFSEEPVIISKRIK